MHHGTGRRTIALLLSSAVALIVSACGVSLGTEDDPSEIFNDLRLPARATAGEEVTLVIEYEQPYPVAIDIECDIFREGRELDEGERGQVFFADLLPLNPEGGSTEEATPVPGTVEATLVAPDIPGPYVVRCLTPTDEDNATTERIDIVADGGS